MPTSSHDITGLLHAWGDGDVDARDQAMTLIYQDLRRRAAAHLRRERPGHTLQPTALVHEAYIRLVDQRGAAWQNRTQFLAIASRMMRRILVDRARARRMAKRSGRWNRIALTETVKTIEPADVDVLALNSALTQLAAFDPRKSQIAELRCFGGLTLEEISEAVNVSVATADRDWRAARAWLIKTVSAERRHDA